MLPSRGATRRDAAGTGIAAATSGGLLRSDREVRDDRGTPAPRRAGHPVEDPGARARGGPRRAPAASPPAGDPAVPSGAPAARGPRGAADRHLHQVARLALGADRARGHRPPGRTGADAARRRGAGHLAGPRLPARVRPAVVEPAAAHLAPRRHGDRRPAPAVRVPAGQRAAVGGPARRGRRARRPARRAAPALAVARRRVELRPGTLRVVVVGVRAVSYTHLTLPTIY